MEVFTPLIDEAARWVHYDTNIRLMWNAVGVGLVLIMVLTVFVVAYLIRSESRLHKKEAARKLTEKESKRSSRKRTVDDED